ncbi:cupin [Trypanosoma rangeli]|uniref:Cupin n=1 Tax=Trypanosoma rangeli TaxID=5698 RepID=A0A422P1M2_TRYRA|nr:cupin [Trypanosoma rangeli]RNF11620.1 cupin [Trypanosoma rangeli]|eukprot:RNF11620.1 cupin [Trypanosoma rangeli]
MNKNIQYWVDYLRLQPHPEGGFFAEVLRSNEVMKTNRGDRSYYTSIYFLLTHENPSRFHRIKSDEVWYYHAGAPLTVHILHPSGTHEIINVGPNVEKGEVLQAVVPKGVIFGSSVEVPGAFAVVGCMCSPGFDYADFELFTKDHLTSLYPQQKEIIDRLAYDTLTV